jgi:hypothetical protein
MVCMCELCVYAYYVYVLRLWMCFCVRMCVCVHMYVYIYTVMIYATPTCIKTRFCYFPFIKIESIHALHTYNTNIHIYRIAKQDI